MNDIDFQWKNSPYFLHKQNVKWLRPARKNTTLVWSAKTKLYDFLQCKKINKEGGLVIFLNEMIFSEKIVHTWTNKMWNDCEQCEKMKRLCEVQKQNYMICQCKKKK